MHFSKTYFKFIHEHAIQLRFEFANIASINASKNVSKMFKFVFEILKKSYDVLFEKFFNQFEFDKILTNTQTNFERIITAIRNQIYEQIRALKNLTNADFQTKNQFVEFLNKKHDAFEIRFLIKIQKKHNIDTFRAMKKAFICQKINDRIHQNIIIFKSQTFFDFIHEKKNR